MSENIQSISQGTYTIGNTNELTFSAGPGIKIDEPSAGTVRIGTDETVLWSGSPTASNVSINLSEPISGFERFAVEWRSYARFYRDELFGDSNKPVIALGAVFVNTDGNYEKSLTTWTTDNGTTYSWKATIHGSFTGNQTSNFNQYVVPLKIIGINRISGSNA